MYFGAVGFNILVCSTFPPKIFSKKSTFYVLITQSVQIGGLKVEKKIINKKLNRIVILEKATFPSDTI